MKKTNDLNLDYVIYIFDIYLKILYFRKYIYFTFSSRICDIHFGLKTIGEAKMGFAYDV